MNDHSAWKYFSLTALLVMALAACAKPRTVVVLMADPDGTVGAMEVSNQAGSQVLDTAGQAVRVQSANTAPGAPATMDAREIQALFGPALEARPVFPEKFLIYFITGTTDLTPESAEQLPHIVTAIKRHHPPEVNIIGHTDRSGEETTNYHLALERAEMVRDHLIGQGLDPAMIQVDSHGEANPLIPTPDGVADSRNRRVEVFVR